MAFTSYRLRSQAAFGHDRDRRACTAPLFSAPTRSAGGRRGLARLYPRFAAGSIRPRGFCARQLALPIPAHDLPLRRSLTGDPRPLDDGVPARSTSPIRSRRAADAAPPRAGADSPAAFRDFVRPIRRRAARDSPDPLATELTAAGRHSWLRRGAARTLGADRFSTSAAAAGTGAAPIPRRRCRRRGAVRRRPCLPARPPFSRGT